MWRDFNDAADQKEDFKFDAQALRAKLLSRLPAVLPYLFPAGKINGKHFTVGNIHGDPGKSLVVELEGPKAGMWIDFATNEGGDILSAWASVMGIDCNRNFPQLLESIAQWLGEPHSLEHFNNPSCKEPSVPVSNDTKKPPMDDLGPPSAKWDYTDAQGHLIACVYRYDTEDGGKQFRPWDVTKGKYKAPNPRPLYNQPQIVTSEQVVLVEGEKAAEALIKQGIVATTAMNGAHAPVSKTDWSLLKDKHVLIWPDHDEAGNTYATRAAQAVVKAGASSVTILQIPENKPEKWDAFDAVEDKMEIDLFIREARKTIIKENVGMPAFLIGKVIADRSPMPDDLVGPRVLTPGGMLVFGGAPKVGKSDFLLSWLVHMAAGVPFLGLTPPRPLRIFYLQSEVEYDYLRERLQRMNLSREILAQAGDRLYVTPQLRFILNEAGTREVINKLQEVSADGKLDILVIDPIRNVFDGGPDSNSENDNNAMLFFLQERVEKIRRVMNPKAGVILVHHTKKMFKKQLEEDPFQALSGASSLRSYYTTGMMLFRPDEDFTDRRLMFELRNGPPRNTMHVDKQDGEWVQLDPRNPRLIQKEYGAKHDAERIRKNNAIVQLIFDEAAEGRVYTTNQFAEVFDNKAGLGGKNTIRQRLSVLATKGYIKFFRNADDYGLASLPRNKFGYLCVEDMEISVDLSSTDSSMDSSDNNLTVVKPTHYKCPQTGTKLPVEDADIWIYHEEQEG